LPYLDPELNGERLLVGANFASAGIGILNDTGIQFVSHITCFFCVENPCSKCPIFQTYRYSYLCTKNEGSIDYIVVRVYR